MSSFELSLSDVSVGLALDGVADDLRVVVAVTVTGEVFVYEQRDLSSW